MEELFEGTGERRETLLRTLLPFAVILAVMTALALKVTAVYGETVERIASSGEFFLALATAFLLVFDRNRVSRPFHMLFHGTKGWEFGKFYIILLVLPFPYLSVMKWGLEWLYYTSMLRQFLYLVRFIVLELFCHGWLYSMLRRSFGDVFCVLASTFALVLLLIPGHMAVGRNISRIALYSLYAVLAGLQTGFAFKKTGGLYNPVLIHITMSAFAALLYYTYAPGAME